MILSEEVRAKANALLYDVDTLTQDQAFKSDSDFLDWVLIPAIRQPLNQTINWLIKDGPELALCLNKDQKSSFADRLKEAVQSTGEDNFKQSLVKVATAFKIDLPAEESEADTRQENSETA